MIILQTMDGHIVRNLKVDLSANCKYPLTGTINGHLHKWTTDGKWLVENVNPYGFYIQHRLDLVCKIL